MKEQRRNERKVLAAFTPAYDLQEKVLLGYIRDLTLQGAMVSGETAVEIDRTVTLGIDFRETSETPAVRMRIPARAAWCRHEEGSNYYNTGFEFLELSDQNKRVIEAVLKRYQFRPEGASAP
jgi:c-di-GMP-binding flagellar brake protein YcgR